MTRCSQAGCASTDLRCFKLYLRERYVLLCGACHDSLSAMGMSLTPVERRQADVRPLVEQRRSFRPRWLQRDLGRDESGRLTA